jgi:hypothetical protein
MVLTSMQCQSFCFLEKKLLEVRPCSPTSAEGAGGGGVEELESARSLRTRRTRRRMTKCSTVTLCRPCQLRRGPKKKPKGWGLQKLQVFGRRKNRTEIIYVLPCRLCVPRALFLSNSIIKLFFNSMRTCKVVCGHISVVWGLLAQLFHNYEDVDSDIDAWTFQICERVHIILMFFLRQEA